MNIIFPIILFFILCQQIRRSARDSIPSNKHKFSQLVDITRNLDHHEYIFAKITNRDKTIALGSCYRTRCYRVRLLYIYLTLSLFIVTLIWLIDTERGKCTWELRTDINLVATSYIYIYMFIIDEFKLTNKCYEIIIEEYLGCVIYLFLFLQINLYIQAELLLL